MDEAVAAPTRRGIARFAIVAGAFAVAAVAALAMAPAGWRLDLWHYKTSFALMRYAAYLALLAAGTASIVLVEWRRLSFGTRAIALLALTVAAVVVAVPAHYARLAAITPPIHDVTTDTVDPPQFWTVLPSRAKENANTIEYGGPAVAQLQRAYYPKIAPVTTALPPPEAFAVALAVARSMPGWIDVTAEPESWRIEASQKSFWMRFTDDVSIRVSSDGTGSRVDVRSLSRQGRGDFGVNARRVSAYADALRGAARRPRPLNPAPADCGQRPGVASFLTFRTVRRSPHERKDVVVMKLLRFGPAGREKPGLLDKSGQIRDLSGVIADITPEQLAPAALAKLRQLDPAKLPAVSGNPRLGAPVANVPKIVAVGLNYIDHANEATMKIPSEPVLFMKTITSYSGPNDDVVLPKNSIKGDWEVELGIFIGAKAQYVSKADALKYVAGYTIVNDVSERNFQLERGPQWMKGKGCDTFCPTGPWLVTPDEVADPQNLEVLCEVSGQVMQKASTKDMIFDCATIISYTSEFLTLMPGDLIATGTPSGVGLGRNRFLKPGDTMRLTVTGLGEQRQKVVAYRG